MTQKGFGVPERVPERARLRVPLREFLRVRKGVSERVPKPGSLMGSGFRV